MHESVRASSGPRGGGLVLPAPPRVSRSAARLLTAANEDSQAFADRWRFLSGIPVEAAFLHRFQELGGARALGYPLTPGVFIGDTLAQYFTHARLEVPGRSSEMPMGVPRQACLGEILARALASSNSVSPTSEPPEIFSAALIMSAARDWAGSAVGQPLEWRDVPVRLFQRDIVRLMPVSPNMRRPVRGNLGELYTTITSQERAAGDGHLSSLERPSIANPDPVVAPVLMYHKTRGADLFRAQVVALLDHGLTPVSLDHLVGAIEGWATLPPRAFVVTFDDGWVVQIEEALPTLVELRVPATFFVMPGFERYGQGHMTVAQFRDLRAAGMTVGSHTVNHARLPTLIKENQGAALAEIVTSRDILEREVDGVDYFAYPHGLFDAASAQVVIETGYRAAVTTLPGIRHMLGSRFVLRRIRANAWATFGEIRGSIRRAAAIDGVDSPI